METPPAHGDPLASAVESLLRPIPERWADFDQDALVSIDGCVTVPPHHVG